MKIYYRKKCYKRRYQNLKKAPSGEVRILKKIYGDYYALMTLVKILNKFH